jgi:hypothetical protein
MLALRVMKHLDLVEFAWPCVFCGFVNFASDTFALEQIEEAFG